MLSVANTILFYVSWLMLTRAVKKLRFLLSSNALSYLAVLFYLLFDIEENYIFNFSRLQAAGSTKIRFC